MTNPKTPNLGLNKIDRSSPSTTYFDLEKYIDQNADSVDEFAGRVNAAIEHAGERLDTVQRQDVVLNAGLQILNAQRRAPFSLTGIKGRTLVNLLGRVGGLETTRDFGKFQAELEIDTVNKTQGSAGLKVIISAGEVHGSGVFNVSFDSGKCYVVVADIKNGNATEGCFISLPGQGAASGKITSTFFRPGFFRFMPATSIKANIDFAVKGAAGQWGTFDAVRIYEISFQEYSALANMTPEQVAAKYPYVDSVQPVRNPYAICYGENLLPPFYEWKVQANKAIINGPYSVSVTVDNAEAASASGLIPAVEGVDYMLTVERVGAVKIGLSFHDKDGKELQTTGYIDTLRLTANSPAKTAFIQTHTSTPSVGGTYQFSDFMLTLGTESKPFKPREDAMLALQTDLFADPLTGANADEVFEKDGQYLKLAKWRKIELGGSINWIISPAAFSGFKVILTSPNQFPAWKQYSEKSTKFDGKILKTATSGGLWATNGADTTETSIDGSIYISISNADSGWGDNYTPTADEIKAYFMGWKMWQGDSNDSNIPYTSGTKRWRSLTSGDEPSILPTTQAPNYTPYQLVYQLATPTVEPIVSEGMLTFNEGDNQVEVGTGIVVRESVIPSLDSNGVWNIGNPVANNSSKGFKYKAKSVEAIYKNSLRDNGWRYYVTSEYGALAQELQTKMIYDPSATYSATYLTLDKSPIVPFNGSYAANEKAMLQELTDTVQQNATAVSVLMNKKAEKDAPGWITPTLLNGWIPYSDGTNYYGYPSAQYMKDSQGFIYLRGLIKNGPVGSVLFYLPEGYRPKQNITFVTICFPNGASEIIARVRVSPDGSVVYMVGPTLPGDASWLSLNLPPFTLH